jgi:chromosome segregation ATPase
MEAADILYGVTMGTQGVTEIVSKRLATQSRPVTHAA